MAAVLTMRELRDYIEAAAREPWDWAAANCCTFAGNWIERQTGINVMRGLAGAYDDEDTAHALIDTAGGLEALVAPRMDCSFERTTDPQDGDVGFLLLPPMLREGITHDCIPGIRFGKLWAVRALRCVRVTPLDFKTAWRIA